MPKTLHRWPPLEGGRPTPPGLAGFARDQSGGASVDWVVLTAIVVGLALASFGALSAASKAGTDAIGDHMVETEIGA